jgi:hypothetical protein
MDCFESENRSRDGLRRFSIQNGTGFYPTRSALFHLSASPDGKRRSDGAGVGMIGGLETLTVSYFSTVSYSQSHQPTPDSG